MPANLVINDVHFVDGGFVIRAPGVLGTTSVKVMYAVSGAQLSKQIGGEAAAYILGILPGVLGSAFDMCGPALVFHANSAVWDNIIVEFSIIDAKDLRRFSPR